MNDSTQRTDRDMEACRLVIVGASGLIGSALLRAARSTGRQAIGTGLSRAGGGLIAYDMRTTSLRSVVADLGANDVVFLLAGYISPAWIFENAEMARDLNLDASRRLADEAVEAGARFVFMSTDLVFDGEKGGYVETAAPRPLNMYGRLKAEMENHVLALTGGIVARTGWNIGWDRGTHCVVAQTYETLLQHGARMAADNVISITDVDDTARGLLALAGRRIPRSRIYHLVSAPGVSRRHLADAIIRTSVRGAEMRYEAVAFSTIAYSEPRPTRAWLANDRTRSELGLTFAAPEPTIARKVALLDRWHSDPAGPKN